MGIENNISLNNLDNSAALNRILSSGANGPSIKDVLEVVESTNLLTDQVIFASRLFDDDQQFKLRNGIQANALALFGNIQLAEEQLELMTGYDANVLGNNLTSTQLAQDELELNQQRALSFQDQVAAYNTQAAAYNANPALVPPNAALPIVDTAVPLGILQEYPVAPENASIEDYNLYVAEYNAIYAENQAVIANFNAAYTTLNAAIADYNARIPGANQVLGSNTFQPINEANLLRPPGSAFPTNEQFNADGTPVIEPPISAALIPLVRIDTAALSPNTIAGNDANTLAHANLINNVNSIRTGDLGTFVNQYNIMRDEFNTGLAAINAKRADAGLPALSPLPNTPAIPPALPAPESITYPDEPVSEAEMTQLTDAIASYNDNMIARANTTNSINEVISLYNAGIQTVEATRTHIIAAGVTVSTVAQRGTIPFAYQPLEQFHLTHGYFTTPEEVAEATLSVLFTPQEIYDRIDALKLSTINAQSIGGLNGALNTPTIAYVNANAGSLVPPLLPPPSTTPLAPMTLISQAREAHVDAEIAAVNVAIQAHNDALPFNATPEPLVETGGTLEQREQALETIYSGTENSSVGAFVNLEALPPYNPFDKTDVEAVLAENGTRLSAFNTRLAEYGAWVNDYNTKISQLNDPQFQATLPGGGYAFAPLPLVTITDVVNPTLPPEQPVTANTPAGAELLGNLTNARSSTSAYFSIAMRLLAEELEEAEEDSAFDAVQEAAKRIRLAITGSVEAGAPGSFGLYLQGATLSAGDLSTIFSSAFTNETLRSTINAIGVPTTISSVNFPRTADSPDGTAIGGTTITFNELELLSTSMTIALLDQLGPLTTRTTVSLINAILGDADLSEARLGVFTGLIGLENILGAIQSGAIDDALRSVLRQQYAGLSNAQLNSLVQAVSPAIQGSLLNIGIGQLGAYIGDSGVVADTFARLLEAVHRDPTRPIDEIARELESEVRDAFEQKLEEEFEELTEEQRRALVDRILSTLFGPTLIMLPAVEGPTEAEIAEAEAIRYEEKREIRKEEEQDTDISTEKQENQPTVVPSTGELFVRVYRFTELAEDSADNVVEKTTEDIRHKLEEVISVVAEQLSWLVPAHLMEAMAGPMALRDPNDSNPSRPESVDINRITSGRG